jgi:enoyl-CoA hydratase/carnithine racemase
MSGFRVQLDGGIATVTIDRPKANAIDAATSRALGEVFVGFEHDPAVRVATSPGRRALLQRRVGSRRGADGEEFDADYGAGGFGGYADLPGRRTPVIAAVNGMAVGGGFEMVMAADLVVAADHATCWLPEAALGMLPDAGSVRLPRLLPPHLAREVLIAGRRLTAADLLQYGMAAGSCRRRAADCGPPPRRPTPRCRSAILDRPRSGDRPDRGDVRIKQFLHRAHRLGDAQEGTRASTRSARPSGRAAERPSRRRDACQRFTIASTAVSTSTVSTQATT